MTSHELVRLIGCRIPVTVIMVAIIWYNIAFWKNQHRNETARKIFESMCKEENIFDQKNLKKLYDLKHDVSTKKISSDELEFQYDRYEGKYDEYKSHIGEIKSTKQSDLIFRRNIYMMYKNTKIIYGNDIVLIQKSLFTDPLTLGFHTHECIAEVPVFWELL